MTELNNTQPLKRYKILVLGDNCIDVYHYGIVDRLSPEAPVPIFTPTHQTEKPGMAANVSLNLKSFSCDVNYICDQSNSCRKTRLIDIRSKQHLLRMDTDKRAQELQVDGDLLIYDAIVISDYNKGAITNELILDLQERFTGPIFVDTKKTDIAKFNKCFVKINALEYSRLTSKCDELIVTRGGAGTEYKGRLYPGHKVEVTDVCGAGDTFLAALTWAYLCTKDIPTAIDFANKCASITVQHTGVYALTEQDLNTLILPSSELDLLLNSLTN